MGIMGGLAQRGPTRKKVMLPVSISVDRRATLEALADRVEKVGSPNWDLDLEVYSAFGFPVRQKLAPSRGRISPGGGIFHNGREWRAVGHLASDLGLTIDIISMVRPHLQWSLQSVANTEPPCYRADIAGTFGTSLTAGSALCAAALRALSHEAGHVVARERLGSQSFATPSDQHTLTEE